jgi:anti-sigma factor RsiW
MHLDELLIGDYVDDALAAGPRAEVEQHLASCAACRTLVADLTEIRRVAASLDQREPPARAWQRINRAIQLEPIRGARWRSPLIWLAAAAALAVSTYVGMRYGRQPAAPAESMHGVSTAAAATMSAEAVEAELRAAESHYEKAFQGLEQIAKSEQNALDPKTAATLQKNLAVIDQAISESREAVRTQPTSEPAVSSLMDNFKMKLALLQDTVALINEMRKGNEAGAARVVSGLKQKG